MNDHHLLYQNISQDLDLGELLSSEVIQSLWGGYGELVRLKFAKRSVIVKHVKLPKPSEHPRGWNTDRFTKESCTLIRLKSVGTRIFPESWTRTVEYHKA